MNKHWNIFRQTIMFLTRIPVGKNLPHEPELLQRTPRYFPLAGLVIGGIHVLVMGVAWLLWQHTGMAMLAGMLATIWATGAFHEDGFADACDGFGGGWTRERILEIMKDSRLGTFGTVGLLGMLSLKWLALSQFFTLAMANNPAAGLLATALVVLAGHSLSRAVPIGAIQTSNYASDVAGSKSKPLANTRLSLPDVAVALITACLPLLLLPGWYALALVPAGLSAWLLLRFFRKWIGGYTGDCLGALQQVSELVWYLGCWATALRIGTALAWFG